MEIEARIAEHLEPARRELERQRILVEQLETVEIDVRSPDRTVTITQTCAGEVTDVVIAPGAFDKHDESSLANVFKKTLQAAREAGRHTAEKLTDDAIRTRKGATGGR